MEPLTNHVPDSRAPQPAAAIQQPNVSAQPSTGTTPSALPLNQSVAVVDDEASVEQQWIQKAKEIIAHTKNDPFSQARLLMELKTEYLAARYGRRIADNKIKS